MTEDELRLLREKREARETRAFSLTEVRIEAREDGKGQRIIGHAAVFNLLSEDLGGFREQISAGAFKDAISKDDVRALFNHDDNFVLGRNKASTLVLAEDEKGLRTVIDLPDTQLARDLAVSMQRGDINQMSFAFQVRREDQNWEKTGEGPWIRTINRVERLWDVSVVTYPAYPQTDAAVRALKDIQEAARRDSESARGLTTETEGSVLRQTTRARLIRAGL